MKSLLEDALQAKKSRSKIEDKLFALASNPRALDFILRGYKTHEIATMAKNWSTKKDEHFMVTGRKSQSHGKKGGKE